MVPFGISLVKKWVDISSRAWLQSASFDPLRALLNPPHNPQLSIWFYLQSVKDQQFKLGLTQPLLHVHGLR